MTVPSSAPPPPERFPPGGPPPGRLVLNLRKPMGPLSSAMISPVVTIDGYPAAVRWGQNVFDAPAGDREVSCAARYLWDYGRADMRVGVPPGRDMHVHYSPPVFTFMKGRMGWNQVPRPGTIALWVVLALPVVMLLLIVAGVFSS